MKNNKGFTLIELLSAIIILAAIMLVAFPILLNTIKNSEKQIDEVTRQLVENAASLYIDNHPDDYPTNDNLVRCIDIDTLVAEKFLEKSIIEQNSILTIKNKISVQHNGTNFEYEITEQCENSTICSLPEGLTPVIHNGTDWVIADSTKEWFNYSRQEWANAVVLKSGVSNTVGTIIYPDGNNNNITAMFVCVPRYQYLIEGDYGVHLDGTVGTKENPGEIKARIIPKEQTTATANYKIPSAFKFDDEELDSIWVGKFELSHTSTYTASTTSSLSENYLNCNNESCYDTATKIRILPNVYSAVNNNISNFFFTIRSMNDVLSLTNSDIHMIKSSEWEATAYFSQSVFGKYGNYLYKGTNKEVFHNNSVITGQSSATTGTSSSIICTYNDISNKGNGPCGTGASTTGNITGVYDMAGGNFEFVMGILSNGANDNSGFSTLPNSRYYDVYTSSEEKVFGDVMFETKDWYNNVYKLGSEYGHNGILSWLDLGGKEKQGAGIFYASSNSGWANAYSTRPVITKKSYIEDDSSNDDPEIEITKICTYDSSSTVGEKEIGAKYTCNTGDGVNRTFYVLSHNNDNSLNLIMNSNICEDGTAGNCTVAWSSDGDSSNGPVTAVNYLNTATQKWTNITYDYPIYDDEGGRFTNFEFTGHARLVKISELTPLGCVVGSGNKETDCPDWIMPTQINVGYWTMSTALNNANSSACEVFYNGTPNENQIPSINVTSVAGVRPVITISKDQL